MAIKRLNKKSVHLTREILIQLKQVNNTAKSTQISVLFYFWIEDEKYEHIKKTSVHDEVYHWDKVIPFFPFTVVKREHFLILILGRRSEKQFPPTKDEKSGTRRPGTPVSLPWSLETTRRGYKINRRRRKYRFSCLIQDHTNTLVGLPFYIKGVKVTDYTVSHTISIFFKRQNIWIDQTLDGLWCKKAYHWKLLKTYFSSLVSYYNVSLPG